MRKRLALAVRKIDRNLAPDWIDVHGCAVLHTNSQRTKISIAADVSGERIRRSISNGQRPSVNAKLKMDELLK